MTQGKSKISLIWTNPDQMFNSGHFSMAPAAAGAGRQAPAPRWPNVTSAAVWPAKQAAKHALQRRFSDGFGNFRDGFGKFATMPKIGIVISHSK
jgi:hypothetical protein